MEVSRDLVIIPKLDKPASSVSFVCVSLCYLEKKVRSGQWETQTEIDSAVLGDSLRLLGQDFTKS
jgi:hypothetical protein